MSSSSVHFEDVKRDEFVDFLACDVCGEQHETETCPLLQNGIIVADTRAPSRARLTLPSCFRIKKLKDDGVSIAAREKILCGTRFGPMEARISHVESDCRLVIKVFSGDELFHFLDTSCEEDCNWMCLVVPAVTSEMQNLMVYQAKEHVYFSATRDIRVHEELRVWYAPFYGKKIGMLPLPMEQLPETIASPQSSPARVEAPVENENIAPLRRGRKRKIYQGFVDITDPSICSMIDEEPQEGTTTATDKSNSSRLGEWRCSQCGDVYNDSVLFARHLRDHYQPPKVEARKMVGQKRPKSHSCQFCAAKFSSGKLLQTHRLRLHRRQLRRAKDVVGTQQMGHTESIRDSPDLCTAKTIIPPQVVTKVSPAKRRPAHISDTDAASILLAIEANCDKPEDQSNDDVSADQYEQDSDKAADMPVLMAEPIALDCNETHPRSGAMNTHADLVQIAVDETDIAMMVGDPIDQDDVFVVEAGDTGMYTCDICNRTFDKSINLYKHLRKHTEEFVCSKCNKVFSRKENLIKHTCHEKHEPDLSCNFCQKIFVTSRQLKRHMEKHIENYSCDDCGKNYRTNERLKEHVCSKKEMTENFLCEICNKSFTKLQYLERHIPVHTGSHTCPTCGKWLRSHDSLFNHMRICGQGGFEMATNGPAACPNCHEEFTDVKAFRRHMYEHTHLFSCGSCGARFRNQVSLGAHICDGENAECKVSCDECAIEFCNVAALNQHKLSHGDPRVKCKQCKIGFQSRDELTDHECQGSAGSKGKNKQKSQRLLPLVCELCGAHFSSTSSLNVHRRLHSDKQFICETCDKRFHRKDLLLDHLAVHGPPTIPCSLCNKMFKTKKSLDVHYLIHDSIKRFTCAVCAKQFYQKGNLLKHEEVHNPERKYGCQYCTKSFSTKEYLALHSLEHTQGKNFSCNLCEKNFVKEHQLKTHIRTFHSNLAWVCKFCGESMKLKHSLKRHLKKKHLHERDQWSGPQQIAEMLMPRYDGETFDKSETQEVSQIDLDGLPLQHDSMSDSISESISMTTDQAKVLFTLSGIGSEALQQALVLGAARIQHGSTSDTIEISLQMNDEFQEAVLANDIEGNQDLEAQVTQMPVTNEQIDNALDYQHDELDQLQDAANSTLEANNSPDMTLVNSIDQSSIDVTGLDMNTIVLENGTILRQASSEGGSQVVYYIMTTEEQVNEKPQ